MQSGGFFFGLSVQLLFFVSVVGFLESRFSIG